MPGVDDKLMFRTLNIAILTVSDTRTSKDDHSGDALAERVTASGHEVASRLIVKDDRSDISQTVRHWVDAEEVDVVLTTGGTGLTGRDVTVEAVSPLFTKAIQGFSVLFHQLSHSKIGLSTLQSRACAGLIESTFVFCLPGSTNAVKDAWDHILCGALDSRYRPFSLVDLIPRLSE